MLIFDGIGSVNWAESQVAKGYTSLENQPEGCSQMPFMDHWNVFRPHISLRDIIKEEQALQENFEKVRHITTAPTDLSI